MCPLRCRLSLILPGIIAVRQTSIKLRRAPLEKDERGKEDHGCFSVRPPFFLILLLSSIPSHDPDSSISTLRPNIKTYLIITLDVTTTLSLSSPVSFSVILKIE